jgi:hypothetical protein
VKPRGPKKPSGAEFRKRRVAAEARAKELLEAERANGAASTNLQRYAALGTPPDSAVEGTMYANKCAVALLHGVMTDPTLDEATRRKTGRELCAVIGMTAVRAIYEQRLSRLLDLVYRPKPTAGRDDDGLENLEGQEQ